MNKRGLSPPTLLQTVGWTCAKKTLGEGDRGVEEHHGLSWQRKQLWQSHGRDSGFQKMGGGSSWTWQKKSCWSHYEITEEVLVWRASVIEYTDRSNWGTSVTEQFSLWRVIAVVLVSSVGRMFLEDRHSISYPWHVWNWKTIRIREWMNEWLFFTRWNWTLALMDTEYIRKFDQTLWLHI
jgi:hypothetical protein